MQTSDCDSCAPPPGTGNSEEKKAQKKEVFGFVWTKDGWSRRDPDDAQQKEDTTIFSLPVKEGSVAPEEYESVIEDLDCKLYMYENVTPANLLDLHCKAVLGIQNGTVVLPKFKTLKMGLEIDGTDLYCTMLYSRGCMWVPGEGFAESLLTEDASTAMKSDSAASSSGSKAAPTPRKKKPVSKSSGQAASPKKESAPQAHDPVLEDIDLKMYGHEDVTPGALLDLHCRCILGIEQGIIALPKFKTLKLGLQIDSTDLYCTMLYSRGSLWVPGEGFNEGPLSDNTAPGTPRKVAPATSGAKSSSNEGWLHKLNGKMDGWLQFSPGVPLAHKVQPDETKRAAGGRVQP